MQIINALLSSFALVDTEPPVISLDMTGYEAWNNTNGHSCGHDTTCDVGYGCVQHNGTISAASSYSGSRGYVTSTLTPDYGHVEDSNGQTGTWTHNGNANYCQVHSQANANERQHSHYKVCEAKSSTGLCNSGKPLPDAKAWDHHDGDLTNAVKTYATLINMDNQVQADGTCVQTYGSDQTTEKMAGFVAGANEDNYGWTCHKEITESQGARASDILLNGNMRSEWLIDYEVEDLSGNKAKSLSFSIIFADSVRPSCTTPSGNITIECGYADSTSAPDATDTFVSEDAMTSGKYSDISGVAATNSGAQQWHTIGYNSAGHRYATASDTYEGDLTDFIQFNKLESSSATSCTYNVQGDASPKTTCVSTNRTNSGDGGRGDGFCSSYNKNNESVHALSDGSLDTARCELSLASSESGSSTFFPARTSEPDLYVGNMRDNAYTQAFAVLEGMIPAVPSTITWRRFYDNTDAHTLTKDTDINSNDYFWNADGSHQSSALNNNVYTLTFGVEDHAGIFGEGGENNRGDSTCGETITFTVSDNTPPTIEATGGTTDSQKTMVECLHTHTVASEFDLRTAKHTVDTLAKLDSRESHTEGDAFHAGHYSNASAHMYYHNEIHCHDKCAGLVWTDSPWSNDNSNQGRVLNASFPVFRNGTDLSQCEGETDKFGFFCTNGADYEGDANLFQREVQQRRVSYFCRDYAGNEDSDTDHYIHVVDTSPPTIALSHLCHDNGASQISLSPNGNFGDRYDADENSANVNHTRHDVEYNVSSTEQDTYETNRHYREFNTRVNAHEGTSDTQGMFDNCVNWLDAAGEEKGHEMYVSAGYSLERGYLEMLFTKPSSSYKDFELAGGEKIDGGWSCRDSCDDWTGLKDNTAVHWDGDNFPTACTDLNSNVTNDNPASFADLDQCFLIPGTYTVKYTCTDKSFNVAKEQKRTIFIEDHKIPIITVLGSEDMSLEATNEGNYVDDGATCSDQVDGMISQNVEVSGAVVNLTREGTYVITYSCADSAGYEAVMKTRTVHVTDCNCPSCTMTGASLITREASFPYEDETGYCTDDLDSDNIVLHYSQQTTTDSQSGTIALAVNVEKTGVYYVTYFAHDAAMNWNYKAKDACNGREGNNCDGYENDIRTVHIVDTLKPVIALDYGGFFQYGDASDTGLNGSTTGTPNTYNPVDKDHASGGVSYMAERNTSLSGWMIGAIASAVTGVALLGYSRNNVATTVPV